MDTRSSLVLGSLLAAGAFTAMVTAACGAGSFGASTGVFGDSGLIETDGGIPTNGDSSVSGSDGSAAADGGSGPVDSGVVARPVGLLAVHASANLYDFRLCFGIASGTGPVVVQPLPAYPDDPSHPMPETNYPGVPVGGAALLPTLPATLFAGAVVTPYVVRAELLNKLGDVSTNASEPTCDQLICTTTGCLSRNLDYFQLDAVTIPFLGGPTILAVEGCITSGVAPGSIAQCGSGYVGASGNLKALVASVAPVAGGSDGTWSVQLANLSPSLSAGDDSGAPPFTYLDGMDDAGVSLSAPYGAINGAATRLTLSDAGVPLASFALGAAPGAITQSLAAMQFFQAPSSDPRSYFRQPVTYFAAVVGDATDAAVPANLPDGAANPLFDGHGLHVIAYPAASGDD